MKNTPSEKKQPQETAENASPFKPGECACGIPDCAGHEIVDGKISFKGHPLGDHEAKVPEHWLS